MNKVQWGWKLDGVCTEPDGYPLLEGGVATVLFGREQRLNKGQRKMEGQWCLWRSRGEFVAAKV